MILRLTMHGVAIFIVQGFVNNRNQRSMKFRFFLNRRAENKQLIDLSKEVHIIYDFNQTCESYILLILGCLMMKLVLNLPVDFH